MAQCACLETCPFFNDKMENMPAIAGMIKQAFCLGSFEKCARYMVFEKLGRPGVPTDLYPSQTTRVTEILRSAG